VGAPDGVDDGHEKCAEPGAHGLNEPQEGIAAKDDLDGEGSRGEGDEIEKRDEVLMRIGEGSDNEAADERGGRTQASTPAQPKRGAEGEFSAPAGTRDESGGLARFHAALADPAHRPVADDQQKEEQDAVKRLFEIARVEAAGGACGGKIGEEKPGCGQKKPRQRTEPLEKKSRGCSEKKNHAVDGDHQGYSMPARDQTV